jgi:type I restriction enzyme M protein
MEIEEREIAIASGHDVLALLDELAEAYQAYSEDRIQFESAIFRNRKRRDCGTGSISDVRGIKEHFDPIAERLRGLVKQVDLVAKLSIRTGDLARDWLKKREDAMDGEIGHFVFDRRGLAKHLKELDAARTKTVDQLKNAVYFHRQAAWLLDRFPEGMLTDVPGLVKLVDRPEIAAADWSLTPGRYVGVAPAEVDEEFDFEQTMRGFHDELAELNAEAAKLASKIQKNFQDIGL